MLNGRIGPLLIATLLAAGSAEAQTSGSEPLSAIDWLSKSVATPSARTVGTKPKARASVNEPPVVSAITRDPISVLSLDEASLDGIGILSTAVTGLPHDLWGTTASAELARLIRSERVDVLPATQALLYTLLLAELSPPVDSGMQGEVFLARIDKLLDLGALDQALALLELVEKPKAETFRRWFDIALLTGQEDRACEVMRKTPDIAPTFPARVFCLARGGDWNAAALSLRTGETLGYIDADMSTLLEHFLDPELFEGEPDLPLPARPSPLVLRLMEAIGQPLTTTTLPVAFAQADLRSNAGWKTRVEAAERLARTGAIDPNRLFGLYTERKAAASGGVWERVAAIRALDTALEKGAPDAVARSLPLAWQQMTNVELEVPFAAFYSQKLAALDLPPAADALAFRIGLLSESYEEVARARAASGQTLEREEQFLIGIATGQTVGTTATDQMGVAIQAAFLVPGTVPPEFAALLEEKRMGEAILSAIDQISDGARGNLGGVTRGLQLLRAVGLERTARRTALELLLLERRG